MSAQINRPATWTKRKGLEYDPVKPGRQSNPMPGGMWPARGGRFPRGGTRPRPGPGGFGGTVGGNAGVFGQPWRPPKLPTQPTQPATQTGGSVGAGAGAGLGGGIFGSSGSGGGRGSGGGGIFGARALQGGRAGAGIFSNPALNKGPVSNQQAQWNVNRAREQFGGAGDIEKTIRSQMGAGQSFGKTQQEMTDTLSAQGHAQAAAAAGAANLQDRATNVGAQLESAKAQSGALSNWQQTQAAQQANMTAPVANALAGLGTNMFGNMANVASSGFRNTPNVTGSTLGPQMQQGAQFTGTQMSAPTIQGKFANVAKSNAGTARVGGISPGSYQQRGWTV